MHNDDENHSDRKVTDRQRDDSKHARTVCRIEVRDLFQGRREILLVHKESEYRLRVTSNDKLILTK